MNYWIFQCKKERYDISDPDVLFDGMTGRWTANQYRSEMEPGDKVFFWLAGDKKYRGIYGATPTIMDIHTLESSNQQVLWIPAIS